MAEDPLGWETGQCGHISETTSQSGYVMFVTFFGVPFEVMKMFRLQEDVHILWL